MGGLSHAVYLGAFFESHDGGDDGQADTFLVAEQLRHFCLRGLSWRPWIGGANGRAMNAVWGQSHHALSQAEPSGQIELCVKKRN
jgi:hypothetical protein